MNILSRAKTLNRNHPHTLFNIHRMVQESVSVLEIEFLDKVRVWESNEEERISDGEFLRIYRDHFQNSGRTD